MCRGTSVTELRLFRRVQRPCRVLRRQLVCIVVSRREKPNIRSVGTSIGIGCLLSVNRVLSVPAVSSSCRSLCCGRSLRCHFLTDFDKLSGSFFPRRRRIILVDEACGVSVCTRARPGVPDICRRDSCCFGSQFPRSGGLYAA